MLRNYSLLDNSIQEQPNMPRNAIMRDCISRVVNGFKAGQVPTLTSDGTSGTYILRDQNEEAVAVFKPIDEEPFAPNNPRGMRGSYGSDTCRSGVKSGELTVREVIAYLLDHDSFADVPATTLVQASHSSFNLENPDLTARFEPTDCGQNLNWHKSTETLKLQSPKNSAFSPDFDACSDSTWHSEH
jgi:hypothetical protein